MRFRLTWSALRALGLGACTKTNLGHGKELLFWSPLRLPRVQTAGREDGHQLPLAAWRPVAWIHENGCLRLAPEALESRLMGRFEAFRGRARPGEVGLAQVGLGIGSSLVAASRPRP